MRRITSVSEHREDMRRARSGWYPLHDWDLKLYEVLDVMRYHDISDFREFVKNRDMYIEMYLYKRGNHGNTNR